MLELVCHHREKNTKRYVFLKKNHYSVGKSLNNDIVLLDAQVLPQAGRLEKRNSTYVWIQNGTEIDLCKEKHSVFGYDFFVQNHRKWVYGLIFLFVSWLSLLAFQVPFQTHAAEEVPSLPAKGIFGNTPKIEFHFETSDFAYSILYYTPGNLVSEKSLKIQVNGELLAFAPATPRMWGVEQSLLIPQRMLKSKNNKLEFYFEGASVWGVKNIYLEATKNLPSQETGNDWCEVADQFLRDRYVRKGNLIRAEQSAQQALRWHELHMQAVPEKLTALTKKIKDQKKQMIEEHMALIQKYRRLNESAAVRTIYRHLLDELIDPMDSQRVSIEREMEQSL